MYLITVEGNIGTGKTTLARDLAKALDGAKVIEEPVAENPYLVDFYQDQKRWALEMQFWLLSTRFRTHQDAIKYIWDNQKPIVMDRSIYGDQIFAKQHYLTGNIDEKGYQSYLDHRKLINSQLLAPHCTIFLEADPKRSLERIKQRGRPFEQDIPLDYLKALQERHAELKLEMRQLGTNVVTIDWNEFKPISEVVRLAGLAHIHKEWV